MARFAFALENASRSFSDSRNRTDKKENQIFLIYKEIQKGAIAYIRKPFLIYV